ASLARLRSNAPFSMGFHAARLRLDRRRPRTAGDGAPHETRTLARGAAGDRSVHGGKRWGVPAEPVQGVGVHVARRGALGRLGAAIPAHLPFVAPRLRLRTDERRPGWTTGWTGPHRIGPDMPNREVDQ